MSAHSVSFTSPPPTQMAAGIAKALPAELSHSPLLGVLGVIMGAGVVTLAGRMLTLGLSDLKGHAGIGFDQGAWIGTSFNVGLMFIGPFTVYLGALIGPRRILLASAAVFALISTFLPFVHNYSLLIVALLIAGLTSGTFYPLTLAFALRSIPIFYLPFTLALYATFVDFAVNVAPSMYGWFREHLSWQWMFWVSALVTPIMMLCIYYGIPATPPAKKSGAAPSFAGFFYFSLGLAILFAALDQGERLDWWHSGRFTALLLGGSFLVVCSLVRRFYGPNPLVDLPYLRYRNTQLLGVVLILFRFALLSTALIVPQTLAIRGFEADQIGRSVIWVALPQIAIAFIAAMLLLSKIDSRLLMATGFSLMASACLINANYTSVWSASNYYPTELLMAVGQSFAFVGLVSTIILQALFSGGLARPQWALTFTAFFHTVRLFGGQIGIAVMTHFISLREKVHSNLLGLHVQQGNWVPEITVRGLAASLFAKSDGFAEASNRAAAIVAARIRLQAYALTLNDCFHLIAWACVLALVLILFTRRSPLDYGDLSLFRHDLAPPQEKRV